MNLASREGFVERCLACEADGEQGSFHQIARRGLKQILDWEKALGESSNRTLKR